MVPFIQAYLADEVELTVQGNGTTTVKLSRSRRSPTLSRRRPAQRSIRDLFGSPLSDRCRRAIVASSSSASNSASSI
jgi:hypothetical protein